MSVNVRRAEAGDLDGLVPLFDAYRVFYEQASDLVAAEKFLTERFELGDSTILLAVEADSTPIGFTQLFPSYSSVAMRRIFVLNDLFVSPEGRRAGVGKALLLAAHEVARDAGAVRVSLRTAVGNQSAQRLYRSLGYQRDQAFYAFDLSL